MHDILGRYMGKMCDDREGVPVISGVQSCVYSSDESVDLGCMGSSMDRKYLVAQAGWDREFLGQFLFLQSLFPVSVHSSSRALSSSCCGLPRRGCSSPGLLLFFSPCQPFNFTAFFILKKRESLSYQCSSCQLEIKLILAVVIFNSTT